MNTQLLRHLVQWEVRHSRRSATFWLMAALAAAVPLGAALLAPSTHALPQVVVAQVGVLSLLVSLWTVFAVKRLVAADVSDDWLLVVNYRQSLVARYVAGATIGVRLWLASALGGAVGLLFAAPEVLSCFALLQPLAALSLLQPIALAAIIIAAADFLVAATPVVLFVLLLLDLLWCFMPVVGFGTPLGMLANSLAVASDPNTAADPSLQAFIAVMLVAAAVLSCIGLIAFGWRRAEDFWTYLRAWHVRQREQQASLGEVRGVLQAARAPKQAQSRQSVAGARERLAQRGLSPVLTHDLARFPWWPGRSLTARLKPLQWLFVGLLVLLVLKAYHDLRPSRDLLTYLKYFVWWILASATVLRALASGAQIVVQEREQQTLESLLVTPLGARRVLTTKLAVVLAQALPSLVLLTVTLPFIGYWADMAETVWVVTLAAAVGGVLASGLSGNRLMATLLALVFTAGLTTTASLGTAMVPWVSRLDSVGATTLHGLGGVALAGLMAAAAYGLVFLAARPVVARVMTRTAAMR